MVASLIAGCTFNFDRSLGKGEIRGAVKVSLSTGGLGPAAGAKIHLSGSAATISSDAQGRFRFANLGAGTYAVDITYDPEQTGHPVAILALGQLHLAAADGLDLGTVTLAAAGSVQGRVFLNGEPVPNAALTVVDANGNVVPGLPTALSDGAGSYELPYVVAGTVHVRALYSTQGNVLTALSAPLTIAPRVVSSSDILLQGVAPAPAGALQGAVAFETTVPASTSITVTITQGSILIKQQSFPAAQPFSIQGLAPGVYTVTISAPGLAPVVFVEVVLSGTVDIGTAVFTAPDPCLTSNGGCDPRATCDSSSGAAVCTCPAGEVGDGHICKADPCLTSNGGCDAHATCDGSSGMAQCTCQSGYSGPGASCTPNVVSLTVAAPLADVMAGATEQLTATASYFDGSMADVTMTATWLSADASLATVSPVGLVTGVAPGMTTITATLDGISGSAGLTVQPAFTVPAAPTNVTAVAGMNAATVSWTAPTEDGGQPVLSYTVLSDPAGNTATVAAGGPTTATVTGLTNGTAYRFTVRATNALGDSPESALSNSVTPLAAPAGLTYALNPAVYTLDQPITDNTPSSSGGPVSSYAITPALPLGLAFDTTTGIVSGVPMQLAAATDYTVTATNAGGFTTATLTIAVVDVPPAMLTYAVNPATYTLGQPITSNTPSSSGGAVVFYAVSPPLPAGLLLDTMTGTISGTPTVLSALTDYTIRASNTGGSTTTTVTISVIDVPPSGLTYATNPAVYTKGQAISNNTPSSSGGPVVSYSITPALPSGLLFDPSTGIMSGTPTVLLPAANYTVTATNTGGSTSTKLTLTVNDVPPSLLTYAMGAATYTKGQAITPNAPSSSGGPVVSYSITPALPGGLLFDTVTGIISGTPTVLSPATVYTITATNSGGSATTTLTLSVHDVPPSGLSYASSTVVYTKGVAIASNVPTSSGGPVVSYAVSPPLPGGLLLDAMTGTISGTATMLSPAAGYTITATNSGGSTTATVNITVNDAAPTGLSYATSPAVYSLRQVIPNNVPSNGGGAVVSYAITPALPVGMGFNTTTGVISGEPLALSPVTIYTVTATNTGGSTTASLVLSVVGTSGTTGSITAGNYHSCAIVNGGVACWGDNSNGQLGNNSTTNSLVPVQVSGLTSGVSALAAGQYFTCALVNGGVRCWGDNANGQLGNGTTTQSLVPVAVTGLTSGVQAIAAGASHACAVFNGGVRCWGLNSSGQLGNNSTTSSPTPVQVSSLTSGATALAAGNYHTCAIANAGAQCWGRDGEGELGNGLLTQSNVPVAVTGLSTGVQAITAGAQHNCAIVNGGVQCWGYNAAGELGDGSTATSSVPVQVSGLTSGAQAIAANNLGSHTCAIVNGAIECWGLNGNGQLGNNSTTNSSVPVASSLSAGAQAITAGTAHTCALVNGGVQCWGYNFYGALGNNSNAQAKTPVAVSGLAGGLQAISAGDYHTCAIVSGAAQCWGWQNSGGLGNGSTKDSAVPVQVTGLTSGVQGIAGGADRTCAVANGGAWCWGSNSSGGLGNNSTTSSRVPVQVSGLSSGVQTVASGGQHSCALVNGGAWCWGSNAYGQLGNNSTVNSLIPVQVTGLTSGVQAVSTSGSHTCALVNGAALCWGLNNYGQLGNNSLTNSPVPVQVSGLTSGVQAIMAGTNATCALVNGGMKCWGENSNGTLGNGTTSNSLVPVQVTGLTSGVQAIAEGQGGTCAMVSGGVQCWGYNAYGQVGNNSTTNTSVPVGVSGLSTGAQAISMFAFHGCAMVGSAVQCWGDNYAGDLGNGTAVQSNVPIALSPWAL